MTHSKAAAVAPAHAHPTRKNEPPQATPRTPAHPTNAASERHPAAQAPSEAPPPDAIRNPFEPKAPAYAQPQHPQAPPSAPPAIVPTEDRISAPCELPRTTGTSASHQSDQKLDPGRCMSRPNHERAGYAAPRCDRLTPRNAPITVEDCMHKPAKIVHKKNHRRKTTTKNSRAPCHERCREKTTFTAPAKRVRQGTTES